MTNVSLTEVIQTRAYGMTLGKRRHNIKVWKTFTGKCNPNIIWFVSWSIQLLQMFSTVYQSRLSLTRRYCVCMAGWVRICSQWNKLEGWWDRRMSQIQVRNRTFPPTWAKVDFNHFAGLLCDLLWSDPDKDITGWSENDRGISFTFGPDVVSRFLQKHDMDLICRAHQVRFDDFNRFSLCLLSIGCGRWIWVLRQTTSCHVILSPELLRGVWQCGGHDERRRESVVLLSSQCTL